MAILILLVAILMLRLVFGGVFEIVSLARTSIRRRNAKRSADRTVAEYIATQKHRAETHAAIFHAKLAQQQLAVAGPSASVLDLTDNDVCSILEKSEKVSKVEQI